MSLRAHPAPEASAEPARVLAVEAVLGRDTRREDPGIAHITLPLPADWFARLDGGELVLVITAPEERGGTESEGTAAGARDAVFDGVAFAFAGNGRAARGAAPGSPAARGGAVPSGEAGR